MSFSCTGFISHSKVLIFFLGWQAGQLYFQYQRSSFLCMLFLQLAFTGNSYILGTCLDAIVCMYTDVNMYIRIYSHVYWCLYVGILHMLTQEYTSFSFFNNVSDVSFSEFLFNYTMLLSIPFPFLHLSQKILSIIQPRRCSLNLLQCILQLCVSLWDVICPVLITFPVDAIIFFWIKS